jgi:hypothetical protein
MSSEFSWASQQALFSKPFFPKVDKLGKLLSHSYFFLKVENAANIVSQGCFLKVGQPPFNFNFDIFRYHGYHEVSGDYSAQYWQVMTMRIIFVVSFYYFISLLRTVMDWMVADEPWNVRVRRKRTIYFIKRLFKEKTQGRSGMKAA